jgi:hypothetical protein
MTECGNDPRSAGADVVRRLVQYVAGYADARADHSGEVDGRLARE